MTEDEQRNLKKSYLRKLDKFVKTHSKSLIGNIIDAFADVSYPNEENLIGSPEHRAECQECQNLHNFFVGKIWKETVDENSYGWLSQAQSCFSPSAWQYFLQAFLIQ